MDWKYKHFNQQATFKAPRESVLEAARAVMTESLGATENTSDGFVARGRSGWHAAIATFRITPIPDGTTMAVELLVERVGGWRGFMLFDVSGFYHFQIRKWLLGIAQRLGQPISASEPTSALVGRGCMIGCVVYLIVGVGLVLLAMPLDYAVFRQSSGSTPGPFSALASVIGFLAGVVAFLYVINPDATIWNSIRERLPIIQKKK